MQILSANQTEAIEKLNKFKVGALFMEPGTGKTLSAFHLVKSVPDLNYILWLTPFQTKLSLRNELNKYGGLDCDIIGIETLSSSDRTYLELWNKLKSGISFIICDESLKIKNWGAKRTRRIIELGKLASFRLILNGTPLSRNLLDIWAQMEFLSPKILKLTQRQFYNTFCEWVRWTKRIGNHTINREWIVQYHNVDYLYSLIKHYVYECDLELQIKQQYINLDYEIDSEMIEEYELLKKKYLDSEMMQALNNNIFIEMTQKMQHTYCCSDEKLKLTREIINRNEQVLIYCKFISSAGLCRKEFPKATILTYGKHSFGLNLQDYNVTVYFDKTFDYAQRIQASHRTYRTGQNKDCIYYDMTGNVGLEKMINKNIETKTDLLQYFKSKSMVELRKEL